jgi:hypothetical protein
MRQRLGLAEILMKDAQIAILDEPTSGLDPQATVELLDSSAPQAPRRERAAVVASARARAERLRPRRAVQRGQYRAHGHGARARPPGARRRLFTSRSRPKGRASPSAWRNVPGRERVERRARTACGCSPTATCGRRRRRPSLAGAAAAAAVGRGAEPRSDLHPLLPEHPTRSAMRREGSALHGLGVVTLKELSDHSPACACACWSGWWC